MIISIFALSSLVFKYTLKQTASKLPLRGKIMMNQPNIYEDNKSSELYSRRQANNAAHNGLKHLTLEAYIMLRAGTQTQYCRLNGYAVRSVWCYCPRILWVKELVLSTIHDLRGKHYGHAV